MSNRRETFFAGISTQSVTTIVLGVLEIVVFSIMSRILSKQDFGYFAALTGIMTICTSVSEAGMGASIIQKKDASETFISTAFSLSWMMGCIGTFLVFILSPYIADMIADSSLTLPLRIMSINIFLACIASVGRSLMLKKLRFKKIGIYSVISYAISSSIGILMGLLGYGLYSIVEISIINLLIFNLILYLKEIKFPKFGLIRNEVSGIASFGGWLTLSVITNNITQQMDRLFLSKWISVAALGSYNRPAGFVSNITNKINGIFDTVLFPMLSDMQNDKSKVQGVFLRSVRLLNSFSIVLFALFFFNAELVITVFFGKQWLDLTLVLQIVSFAVIFSVDNRLVDCFFRSLAMVNLGFRLRVFQAVFTFVLLYVGAKYGTLGVAISLLLANIITVWMKVFMLCVRIKLSFFQVLKSCFFASKPILFLSMFGVPYLIFTNHTLMCEILFAAIFCLAVIYQFVFKPELVGDEYTRTLYPLLAKVTRLRRK